MGAKGCYEADGSITRSTSAMAASISRGHENPDWFSWGEFEDNRVWSCLYCGTMYTTRTTKCSQCGANEFAEGMR